MLDDIDVMEPATLRDFLSSRKEGTFWLIDVRQPDEYSTGHIPGSLLIPLPEIEHGDADLPLQGDLIFYCRSGARSMAAALLAQDDEAVQGKLTSLKGGFTAWEGKGLTGFPRVKTFPENLDLEEMLILAMDMEKGAETFYRTLLKSGPSGLAGGLAELADMEIRHARTLHTLLTRKKPDQPSFETLYASLTGDVMEGGLSPEELVKEAATLDDCIRLADLALEIEHTAYDLYRNLAHGQSDRMIRDELIKLAQQEKTHIKIIARGLKECS